MKRLDELQSMKKEYLQTAVPQEGAERMQEAINRARREKQAAKQKKRVRKLRFCGTGTAAAAAVVILLANFSPAAAYAMSNVPVLREIVDVVTFRQFHAESSNHQYVADVKIPQLTVWDVGGDSSVSRESLEKMNQEMETISESLIDRFEADMMQEEQKGYAQLMIDYDVIWSAEEYLTVKLVTYVGTGSGYERDYYYTLDLQSGRQLDLADLFEEGTDYITPISQSIKKQMRQRMAENEDLVYWIDSEATQDDWDFQEISPDQSFYIDGQGRLVITFNEGDAAPMYMGCLEFIIPASDIKDLKDEEVKG